MHPLTFITVIIAELYVILLTCWLCYTVNKYAWIFITRETNPIAMLHRLIPDSIRARAMALISAWLDTHVHTHMHTQVREPIARPRIESHN